jgi:hypothetical protein
MVVSGRVPYRLGWESLSGSMGHWFQSENMEKNLKSAERYKR